MTQINTFSHFISKFFFRNFSTIEKSLQFNAVLSFKKILTDATV